MSYVYNSNTGLWYEVTAVVVGSGVTLTVSDTGVANPPVYIPGAGEPLIDAATYMAIMGLTEIPNLAQWSYVALAISDMIERYCWYSWRDNEVAVPAGLQLIVARAIASAATQTQPTATAGLKSESFSSYSYTLADGVSASAALSPFYNDLRLYRKPFLGA